MCQLGAQNAFFLAHQRISGGSRPLPLDLRIFKDIFYLWKFSCFLFFCWKNTPNPCQANSRQNCICCLTATPHKKPIKDAHLFSKVVFLKLRVHTHTHTHTHTHIHALARSRTLICSDVASQPLNPGSAGAEFGMFVQICTENGSAAEVQFDFPGHAEVGPKLAFVRKFVALFLCDVYLSCKCVNSKETSAKFFLEFFLVMQRRLTQIHGNGSWETNAQNKMFGAFTNIPKCVWQGSLGVILPCRYFLRRMLYSLTGDSTLFSVALGFDLCSRLALKLSAVQATCTWQRSCL